jgi:hypothetical protein
LGGSGCPRTPAEPEEPRGFSNSIHIFSLKNVLQSRPCDATKQASINVKRYDLKTHRTKLKIRTKQCLEGNVYHQSLYLKKKMGSDMVTHIYNPSYMGGRDQDNHRLRPA